MAECTTLPFLFSCFPVSLEHNYRLANLSTLPYNMNKIQIMLGKCLSTPELLPDGALKLKEQWQWLSGDKSSGYSELEEIDSV